MSAGSNFFICSCAVLILTITNLGIGPIINHRVGESWGLQNCEALVDDYEDAKEKNPNMDESEQEKYELEISTCKNKKAMYNMEYTSFIINMVVGFICILLGLYGLQKEVLPKTGMIGMACGVIGFVLTFVYVIFNGIVYTNYYDKEVYKIDEDGSFALKTGRTNKTNYGYERVYYDCIFYNKPNDTQAYYAKFSELAKSQYNYDKELSDSFEKDLEKKNCQRYSVSQCVNKESVLVESYYYSYTDDDGNTHNCSKLYYNRDSKDNGNYDISVRILTVLILSIFTLLCYCGLIFSSFMLSKQNS